MPLNGSSLGDGGEGGGASERWLEEMLGPRRQELAKVIPMTIIYVVVFVTGVVGNIATCIVIARNHYMHTVTNFYLVNLAVSDLLLVRIYFYHI